jgi:hypothetical protein
MKRFLPIFLQQTFYIVFQLLQATVQKNGELNTTKQPNSIRQQPAIIPSFDIPCSWGRYGLNPINRCLPHGGQQSLQGAAGMVHKIFTDMMILPHALISGAVYLPKYPGLILVVESSSQKIKASAEDSTDISTDRMGLRSMAHRHSSTVSEYFIRAYTKSWVPTQYSNMDWMDDRLYRPGQGIIRAIAADLACIV